ncbi:VOC family protein [Zobellella sp. DQSA1]|uniref:VOC family protein n=1 Tax=Zobellella sp. DQSA1 TaxID=3342386 RepID=UPI0035C0BC44
MTHPLRFGGGRNIALKVPPHQFEATVAFYRDVLALRQIDKQPPSVAFEFGACQLWIDQVPGLSQAETWLEVVTNDLEAAAKHLQAADVVRRDEIEPLPEGFAAFWIANPAQIIHLLCLDEASLD